MINVNPYYIRQLQLWYKRKIIEIQANDDASKLTFKRTSFPPERLHGHKILIMKTLRINCDGKIIIYAILLETHLTDEN